EGFANPAHREMLGLRGDVVERGKVKHGLDRYRRAGGGGGDAALLQEQREDGDGNWLGDGADEVQSAVGGEGVDHRVPVELHVDGADEEIEGAGEFFERGGVSAGDDVGGAESARLVELAFAGGEGGDVAAV